MASVTRLLAEAQGRLTKRLELDSENSYTLQALGDLLDKRGDSAAESKTVAVSNRPGEQRLQIDHGLIRVLEQAAGAQNLDSCQPFAGRKIQSNIIREAHGAALLLAFQQPDVERVRVSVICDSQGSIS